MAGDWIKMTTALHENPHVIAMADELDVDELHVIGMLYRIWAWADAQTLNGSEISTTAKRLDRLVHFNGFCDALRKVGWLEGQDNNLTFPRFAEHNGETAKKRALGRNRTQRCRSTGNANSVTDSPYCDAHSVTPVTQAELPEKNIEEYNDKVERKLRSHYADRLHTSSAHTPDHHEFDCWLGSCLEVMPIWQKTGLNAVERQSALSAFSIARLNGEDFALLKAYYGSKLQEDKFKKPYWRPVGRKQFWDAMSDVLAHAERWSRETGWKLAVKKRKPDAGKNVIGSAQDEIGTPEDLRRMIGEN